VAGKSAVRPLVTAAAEASVFAPVPVARPNLPAAEALLPYLRRLDEARWYSNFGPLLLEMEDRLAARFGQDVRVITGVNATQVLTLTLKAMNLAPGSLCMVPAWTFVATAHAVIAAGLVPFFVDVDPVTWMLDPGAVGEALARAPGPVSAVIPVSAFGAMPDLAAWRSFREATGVAVLVDAAAAFDAADDARLPLVVSLHATKVLGIGEGGYLATTDQGLADRVRQLTTYGFRGTRESHLPATNAKLSEYAAVVGHAALDAWPLDRLRYLRASQLLRIALTGLPQVSFQAGWGSDWVTSVCVVRLPDGAAQHAEQVLTEAGVDTRRWWGDGCHLSPAFAACPSDAVPVTDRLAGSTLGIPFAIDLDAGACGRIAAALETALRPPVAG
jgi:dTDP-4-amino-4,6-dideoxygalactose transaminase